MLYALVLLGEDGEHFGLNGLHLVVQLLETCHLAPVPMHLGLQQAIVHFDQCCVDVERLMPSRQEFAEVVVTILLNMRVAVLGAV